LVDDCITGPNVLEELKKESENYKEPEPSKSKKKKKKQKADPHPFKKKMQFYETMIDKIRKGIKHQASMIKVFHRYEDDKEGIKEGCEDIAMKRAERQIE